MVSGVLPVSAAMLSMKPGSIVRVRSRKWLVSEVVRPLAPGQDTLVRLACLEDDAMGEALDVLWERELDAQASDSQGGFADLAKGFDSPLLFSAWLHTLYWNRVSAADPELFQAPDRAGIEVKTYQLEPLRKALRLPRVNLFIADDVGLGKTIEAGLIVRELILRQRARRIVIMAPPSVVVQWQEEMEERFGLTFRIYDRDFVLKTRRERGHAVNPWNTHHRFIISHALIRNETYAASLRDWLGEANPAPNSLLILDEAHNAAPASGTKYAVDSSFTKIIRSLAHHFEHKLFLSATPHNGHSNSFTALLELLDPQRFCRGIHYPDLATRLKPVLVRRLKRDLRLVTDGFPERILSPIIIDQLPESSPELQLSHLLQAYREQREQSLAGARSSESSAALLVINHLQKRLLSSFRAFAHTLDVHIASLKRSQEHRTSLSRDQVRLLGDGVDGDDELADQDEALADEIQDQALSHATQAGGSSVSPAAWQLLEQMRQLVQRHRYEPDVRVLHLITWIQTHLCPQLGQPQALWLPRRLIIFTEYTATKDYLHACLQQAVGSSQHGDARIATFQGGMDDEQREILKNAFNAHPDEEPLRILIATDAAREGVNLQNHCYDLLHFDVPWNPARMEQRNGRIDRKLQKSPRVYCSYFVLPQRAEDKVLDTLVHKSNTILAELGSMSPVVQRNLEALMKRGINHRQATDLRADLERADQDPRNQTIGAELEPTRASQELERALQKLGKQLQKSRDWLRLNPEHFRQALSSALVQLGAEPLQPLPGEGPARWQFPALESLQKAGPGWAVTLDTLRPPRPRESKLWDWRRNAAIRPVVFADPGNMDRKQVHLHLEHRVVQRLLGGFKTRGFHDQMLSRACICKSDQFTQAQIVLIGRLSLYGPHAGRLYDDILTLAASWSPLEGASTLHDEDRSAEVWKAVLHALTQPQTAAAPELQARLRASYTRDCTALEPILKQRSQALEQQIRTQLRSRGDDEARKMRKILQRQKELLQRQIEPEQGPSQLDLPGLEADQYRREQAHWEKRLSEIDAEMENEPARVRRTYAVQASRFEPLGIVWLWPNSL